MSQTTPQDNPNSGQHKLLRRLRRMLWRSLIWIFGSIVALWLFLQLPFVQHHMSQKTAQWLSSELQTKVEVGNFRFMLFNQWKLQDIYIEDPLQDTLLYAREISLILRNGLAGLLHQQITIEGLHLKGLHFYLRKDTLRTESNLAFLRNYFQKEQQTYDSTQTQQKKPVNLQVHFLDLEDIIFDKLDSLKGEDQHFHLARGHLVFSQMQLPDIIALKNIRLEELRLSIDMYQPLRLAAWGPPPPPDSAFKIWYEQTANIFTPLLPFDLYVDSLEMHNSSFHLHNYRREPERLKREDVLDYQHMDILDINIALECFEYQRDTFRGRVHEMNFRAQSGFICNNLSANEVFVSPREVQINGLLLETPYSRLGDTLRLKYQRYADFIHFPDKVFMDFKINASSIALEDIMTFAPPLENNPFFVDNRYKTIDASGRISGRVNSLRGRNLELNLAGKTYLQGNFNSFNLAVPDQQSLNISLEQLNTHISALRQLLPKFDLPANYDKLGALSFSGSFDGFFQDFVAHGDLQTQLGRAIMDLRMVLPQGLENADYSGELDLIGFDLGKWTGNPQIGRMSGSTKVINGHGLSANTASAKLLAHLDSLDIRGYVYRDLDMKGRINQNLFDGLFSIHDPNVDFSFEGSIDFTGKEPILDFTADIRTIKFKKLNLSSKDYELAVSMDIDLHNLNLSSTYGQIALRDLNLITPDSTYCMDSMLIQSSIYSDTSRQLSIISDLMQGEMNGHFDLETLPQTFFSFAHRNYPRFASAIGLPVDSLLHLEHPYEFDFELHISNSRGFEHLLSPKLHLPKGLTYSGAYHGATDSMALKLRIPLLQWNNILLDDLLTQFDAQGSDATLDFNLFNTQLNDKIELAPINLLGYFYGDTLRFGITAHNFTEVLNNLELDGELFPVENDFGLRFDNSEIVIWHEKWNVRENNFLRFGKNYIYTRDFVLTNGLRTMVLESIDNKGLGLYFKNFDFHFIDQLWDYKQLEFKGPFDASMAIDDLFQMKGIEFQLHAPKLQINRDDWGSLNIELTAPDLKDRVTTYINLQRNARYLTATGYYYLPNYQIARNRRYGRHQPNTLDLQAHIANYPLNILEYWLDASIKNTVGSVDARVQISGTPLKPHISGTATAREVATTIKVINTRYFVDQGIIQLTDSIFSVTHTPVLDELGNIAYADGGITHNHFRNFGLNVRLETEEFLGLNTPKSEDALFYGTAIGRGKIFFTGSFKETDMYIRATALAGTRIFIPVSYERSTSPVDYIHFSRPNPFINPITDDRKQKVYGLQMEMDFRLTPEASMEIIFDEQAGDILRGRGTGDIRMNVGRDGSFEMFGNYRIESGEYLFTMLNVVNKPFVVDKGGTIHWTGDPFNAEINLKARYLGLSASIANFIPEYLIQVDEATRQAARIPTEVDLFMILTGNLLKPDISFDLAFPSLHGELKTYVENKLRIIRQDPNEMNRQVFGLIVMGEFIPANFSLQGQELNTIYNTVTEMLSQQLSNYLTNLVAEWLREDGLISGIDFNIIYNTYQDQNLLRGNEIQVQLKNYLFNDRLTVNIGGNLDVTGQNNPTPAPSSVYFAGNYVVEYFLTPEGNLKIRAYHRTEPDIAGSRVNKTGLGLSYRKEFDSFDDFLKGLRKTVKKN